MPDSDIKVPHGKKIEIEIKEVPKTLREINPLAYK